jgi:hypothetical protein
MIQRNLNKLTTTGKERNHQADLDYGSTLERPVEELITDDKEILGDHARGLFRDQARKKADNLVDKIARAEGAKDTVTRREKYLEARSNFTQTRIDKLEARIENSSDNMFTKRLNGWRREKLRDLKAKNKKRTASITSIEKKRQGRPEELQRNIDKLVKNKIDAMHKKAQDVELRRNGIKKHNILKRHEFLAKLTPDDKKRIVREAIRQVRKKNVELGRLERGYSVDDVADENTVDIRKVTDDYGRIIE